MATSLRITSSSLFHGCRLATAAVDIGEAEDCDAAGVDYHGQPFTYAGPNKSTIVISMDKAQSEALLLLKGCLKIKFSGVNGSKLGRGSSFNDNFEGAFNVSTNLPCLRRHVFRLERGSHCVFGAAILYHGIS
jgi:hypothetical protein